MKVLMRRMNKFHTKIIDWYDVPSHNKNEVNQLSNKIINWYDVPSCKENKLEGLLDEHFFPSNESIVKNSNDDVVNYGEKKYALKSIISIRQ